MGTSCSKYWYQNTSCIEHGLYSIFRKWGLFVSNHPLITIICSLIFGVILSIFILFIEDESDIAQLFAPKGTISYDNYNKYMETWNEYEDNVGFNNIVVSDKYDPSKNILNIKYLSLFQQIYQDINSIEIQHNNTKYKYQDICYKNENGNCRTISILELFHYNDTNIKQQFNTTLIPFPSTYSPYSYKQLFIPLILGQNITTKIIDIASNGINTPSPLSSSSNGMQTTQFFSTSINTASPVIPKYIPIVTGSPAFQLTFTLDTGHFGDDICSKWNDEFLIIIEQYATDQSKNDLFAVSYEGYLSFTQELTRAVASDVTSFVISFMLLSAFSTIMILRFKRTENGKCFKCDGSRSRHRIGWLGIVSSMLAVGSSFGFVGGIMGIKFNSVVSVAPFLLVGLGLDDMFVLLRAYELTSPQLSIQERIAITMERGGISIMFTSITDLVAFCVGSTSPFGSISAFCIYCGVGVFMDFVFQITFFLGFMVYDSRWQQSASCSQCLYGKITDVQPTKDGVELHIRNSADSITNKNKKESTTYSGTSRDKKQSMMDPIASSYIMEKLGGLILGSNVIKLIVILLFIAYLIGATYGILGLHADQDPVDLAPKDSYLVSTYNAFDRYFNVIGLPVQFIMDKPLDYSNEEIVENINKLVIDIRNDECFINNTAYTTSWIHDYMQYLNKMDVNLNHSMFYDILYNEYLMSDHGEPYIQDIWNTIITQQVGFTSVNIINDTDIFGEDIIGAHSYQYIDKSRIWLNLEPTGRGTAKFKECIDNLQSIQNNYQDSLGTYYYTYFALFAESDLITVSQTIYNLIYAVIAACIITIILIPYPLMALFVMTTVGQILYGVLGYMSLWGLPINTTTMINVVISVGFSVDNAAHFCHAFMNTPLNTDGIVIYIDNKNTKLYTKKNERYVRVLYALNAVGMPIFAGDLSTIIALLPLATAQSEIFLSFWKCILLVMIFGVSYSMLYLPLILSTFGPLGFNKIINRKQEFNENNNNNNNNLKEQESFETYKQ